METILDSARKAIDAHAWSEAVAILKDAAKAGELNADGYELLGLAAWWVNDIKLCIDAREKAYALYAGAKDEVRAGMLSLMLAESYYYENAKAVSGNWYRLAKELLEKHKDSSAYGWFLRSEGQRAIAIFDAASALQFAKEGLRIAKAQNDRNLEYLCQHDIGRFSLELGNVQEGLEMMENTMTHIISGNVEPMTTGKMFCNMIDVCDQLVDYQRAAEWDTIARNWCDRVGHSSGFPGVCRIKRAGLMRRKGAWAEAEQEALKAKQELLHFTPMAAQAVYEVGEIRLRLGDFDKAENAFREAHAMGFNPLPGLALLYNMQGKSEAGFELLESALNETTLPLLRISMLAALGNLALKLKKNTVAEKALEELMTTARQFESQAILATANLVKGQMAFARGNYEEAIEAFRNTMSYWLGAELPYEAAVARKYLAETFAKIGRFEAARLEWEAALRVFENLGARLDAEEIINAMGQKTQVVTNAVRKAMMFTDIVGSTALISIIGDVAWKHLVQWHDRILRGLFEAHRGREVDQAGDGFFVEFEKSEDAVACAKSIQQTLLDHRTKHGFAPNVRIGIHCAEVTAAGSSLIGLEVHKAARIASIAEAGQITASADFVDAMNGIEYTDRRSVLVKGIADPVEVVLLKWEE